ncbi:probable ATP-dependent RNA helicase ddx20 [Sipha flava]|uniref:RNA helicase n=1 Tax=Sipha flava TaxID=143950 RepID=A0A8B8GEU1_9HEMI|nr:probable ATP-dependent RNA helicase ddx20 [Sipha flava]
MPTSEYSKDTERTTDVQTHDQTPFSSIITNCPRLLKGLTACGYVHASPIQVAAIPTIIAGNDTIVEAKNGTGKTLSFVIPTLVRLKVDQSNLQTIVLAPTREIAVQIQQCFKKVGQYLPDLKCEYFIGGTSVEIDKEKANGCQIAVGSPGRIKHLLNEHVLKGSEVKSFILDEVDRLFTDKNFTKDIRVIDSKLPKLKQMIVVSASIDKKDMSIFDEFMKEYIVVKGAEEDMNASQDPSKFLLGIKQYVACVKAVSTNIILLPAKNVRLLNILHNLPYTQCIIFTNYMTRVEAVCNMLRDHNYKADYIRGDQDQNIRLKLVDRLTSFKSRILVATDLIARGIDSSNVDLVINMDCPNDSATYLHRIGRAGRFGNKGNAFTILDDDKELKSFKKIINSIENVKIKMLPITIEKPILDYTDNELKDLDLTVESDLVEKHQNENNVLEENGNKIIENNQQSNNELNNIDTKLITNSVSVESKPVKKIKSVFGPGISEEESLQKLCKVVEETEKKLIENNLVNKKHLSDRSFILFDPEPFLDDSDQHTKLSPEELKDILKKFNFDFKKNEFDEKSMSEKSMLEKDSEKELSNDSHVCLDNDFEKNGVDEKSISEKSMLEKDSEKEVSNDSHVCLDNDFEKNEVDEKSISEKCMFEKSGKKELSNDSHVCSDDDFKKNGVDEKSISEKCMFEKSGEKELSNDNHVCSDDDFKKNGVDEKSMSEKCMLEKGDEKELSNDVNHVCLDNDLYYQSNNTNDKKSATDIDQQSQYQYAPLNNSEKQLLTDEVNSESNLLNKSNNVDTKIHTNTRQQPRFTNIFELFQVPDFSDLKPANCENSNNCSTNEQYSIKEESDKSHTIPEKYIKQEQCDEKQEEEEDVEENDVWFTDEEEFEVEENESFDEDIEIGSSFYEKNSNDESSNHSEDDESSRKLNIENCYKSIQHNSIRNNIQKKDTTFRRVVNDTNVENQLMDYDLLNDWYQQWRQQMHFIQTLVRMSK